ncbi:unnamed protein product [Toxocara canis]|uniref:PHD-type domain-containing protein n=1 Tax=Toxocara canis TaxID=6265 RepID=A0A183V770_TOXCA|nr:unnamed protein product [Toxocara canis]
MAGCGLGHICESWDLVSDILKSRATLTSNNVSSTSPVAHSPTASANSTSDECTSLLHKNCAPSYSDRGKRENCSFDTVISSHDSNESISASEDRFELKDVDAIERRWLKFFLSLSEWKSDEISLLIQELRQLCKNYRTLLKTALPKTLADARHSACKEKIRRCEKKLEKYASEVHLKDNLKKPIPKANQNGLARSSNGGEESTKKEMKRMVGEPPSRKRSRKNASSGSPSTAVTEYVAMPKERPRRHIQLPARYRFGDEIVEEEWLVRKQNSSPSALLNIQFKETEHSQPKIEPSGTLPTVNKLPKPSTSAIDATSDRMEKIVVIRENEHGVEEELNGHASSDGDSVKIFADDRIINIEPTRERKRDGMGIVRKVTSYVVHLKNGTSQRVSKRVYQMWRRHSKEEMNVPKSPNTETNSSAIAETWQKRGQVESRPGISDDLMKGRHREEMQTSNEAHVASHGKRRSPVTPKLKVEQKKTAEVVGTCTGRHIPVGMPERGGKEDKLPEIMNCLVEKGRSDKHRATSHVEEEQQRVTSPVPNAEQEMEGDHKNVAKVDPNLQEENSSSPQDQAHIVDHSCHQMAPRTQSTVSSDEGEDNVKLKTQNEHLLLISENGFVESLRSRWMNVPLNGRYDDHVMHIKTLIVALQKCLDDRSATWADYFGQKQIVQSTIDSLLTAFSTDRLASTPCAQATALSSDTFFTQPTVLSVQSTTRCGDFRSIRSEVGNVSGRSSVASSRCLGARPVSLASADFGSSSPALNGDLQMAECNGVTPQRVILLDWSMELRCLTEEPEKLLAYRGLAQFEDLTLFIPLISSIWCGNQQRTKPALNTLAYFEIH